MKIFHVTPSSGYETVGCYMDTGERAIEILEGKDPILDGSYSSRKNPLAKCSVAAMRVGYSMFAVRNGGECFGSATAPHTFDKYGKSDACGAEGAGGPWANQVYVIKGNYSITRAPAVNSKMSQLHFHLALKSVCIDCLHASYSYISLIYPLNIYSRALLFKFVGLFYSFFFL